MNKTVIPIILLAAGQSSRMRGRDKLLEVVDGEPLLRRQAMMALAANSGPVIVTLPSKPHPRYDVIDDLEVTRIAVPDAAEGMAASLRRGFSALPPDTPAAMLLLADLPDLTIEDLRKCLQSVDLESNQTIWRGATKQGEPGHPIIFSAVHFPEFAKLTGDNGGREIVVAAKDRSVLVPLSGEHARRDLDTPEAWEKWRAENPDR
jgi:molybdenum cofactor cytidylyltransferase